MTGYVKDILFRSGICPGQFPTVMQYVSLLGGFVPDVSLDSFTYCDLGCGEGTTLISLAYLYPNAMFFGIDFNEKHIELANEAKNKLGLKNVEFILSSFTELLSLDLPEMDYIGMNGVYSWLEEDIRNCVDAFIDEKLKKGGLLYLDYITAPGKISIYALWKFIQEMTSDINDSFIRAEKGIELLEMLLRRGIAFFSNHPNATVAARIYIQGKKIDPYKIEHFAHNALAKGFYPFFFSEIYERMRKIGLSFAGRTDLFTNDLELCVHPLQLSLFEKIDDTKKRELLKDFIRDEHERRDVWIKKEKKEEEKAADEIGKRFWIFARSKNIIKQISVPGGYRINISGPIYDEIIDRALEKPLRLFDISDFQEKKRKYVKVFSRLIASGQFFLLVNPDVRFDSPEISEDSVLYVSDKINKWIIERNVNRLQETQLVSSASMGVSFFLSPLETIILYAFDRKSKKEVVDSVFKLFYDKLGIEKVISIGNKEKRIDDIEKEEIEKVLNEMCNQKIKNLYRLKIIDIRR